MLSRVNLARSFLRSSTRSFAVSSTKLQTVPRKTEILTEDKKQRLQEIEEYKKMMNEAGYEQTIYDIKSTEDLFGKGPKEGEVPTEYDQATGAARLELLGKMAGIDIFDLGSSTPNRIGTMEDPIPVLSYDDYKYVACGGIEGKNIHEMIYLRPTTEKASRCPECGQVYKVSKIVGNEVHAHTH
ncbi:hypothetical protein QEN19_002104 [Hanseniaspora menglaensis]